MPWPPLERMSGHEPPPPWWVMLQIAAWCWAAFHIAFDARAIVEWFTR